MYINENGLECFDIEDFESLPVEVQAVLSVERDNTYVDCAELVAELEEIGYTAEYYLDAEIFDLRKL